MPRHNARTYRSAAAAQAKVLAARQALLSEVEQPEPMHRYPHPIPAAAPAAALPSRDQGDSSAAMTQVLEQLSCQSQLLVDLLGAVNALTAAVLCRGDRS